MIPTMIRGFEASSAVAAFKIVRFSEASTTSRVAQAAVNSDPILGVSGNLPQVATDMVDVTMSGIGLVTLGGTVTAGAELTTDASGNAIVAVPTAGVFMQVVGKALAPGVAGDVIEVLVSPRAFFRGA
jgi:hypothetical protein